MRGYRRTALYSNKKDITIKKDDTNETEHNNKSNDKMRQCKNTDNQYIRENQWEDIQIEVYIRTK